MNIVEIISDKRYGKELSDEQIKFFIDGVTDHSIPDYQISALLMAIVLNGMNEREMTTLTMCMADSGDKNDLSYVDGIPVDKHSTGGVGDKVTPILLPLSACFGVVSVKLSGRGLGFTGGTVDKFESIENFNVSVSSEDFPKYAKNCGMVISGQTPSLAPADKVLYALRDVTATVDSIPLIASSIMSKKIAGGAHGIVLDVTTGSGAFMKDLSRAKELSDAMLKIGKLAGREVVCVITDMDQPLGCACGNVLEMQEVFATLSGNGPSDVVDVVTTLCAYMVKFAKKDNGLSVEEIKAKALEKLQDGSALSKFQDLILSQGGMLDSNGCPVFSELPMSILDIHAPCDGYISRVQADMVGNACVLLGAGRSSKEDKLDFGAGVKIRAKVGDSVKRGDVLCTIYKGAGAEIDENKLDEAMEMLFDAYEFSDEPVELRSHVIDIIE